VVRELLVHLGEAHRRGVVHHDVNPSNVIEGSAVPENTWLIDFGSSETIGATHLERFSTPAYAAPEIWTREPVTPSSDLYAAAGVLLYLLTGEPPLPRDIHERSDQALYDRLMTPPSLTGIDDGLRQVLEKALSPNARDRYPSAEAFRKALEPYAK
jgi:serine/threonine-protein kinase